MEQPPLLVQTVRCGHSQVGGEAALGDVQQVHRVPLQALGRVHRGQHQPVLVHARRHRVGAGGAGRVEGQLDDERAQVAVLGGGRGQPLQVGEPGGGIRVRATDHRHQRRAESLGPFPGGCRRDCRAQRRHEPGRVRPGALRQLPHRPTGRDRAVRRPTPRGRVGRQVRGVPAVEDPVPVEVQRADDPPGRGRSDPVQQLQQPEPGGLVAGVVGQPVEREQILDVRGLQVAQPAVLDVRDPAAGQLELQQVAVGPARISTAWSRSRRAALPGGQHARRQTVPRPGSPRRQQSTSAGRAPPARSATQLLGVPAAAPARPRWRGRGSAGVERKLRSSRTTRGAGELRRQVAGCAGARRRGSRTSAWASSPTTVSPVPPAQRPRTMSTCSWLTSWYSSTSTSSQRAASRRPEHSVGAQRPPVEQQIVEVEQAARALAGDVGPEHAGDRLDVRPRPRETARRWTSAGRPAGVHRAGVDVGEHALCAGYAGRCRSSPCSSRTRSSRSAASAGSITATSPRQAERVGVRGDHPVRDRVERAAPGPRPAPVAAHAAARPSISAAARRVNVSSSTRSRGTPRSSSRATRAVSVVVFPVPAPASTSSGPPSCSTAPRCSSSARTPVRRYRLRSAPRGAPLRESR